MKWLFFLVLASGYTYFLIHTTDIVTNQVTQLNQTYQLAAGR